MSTGELIDLLRGYLPAAAFGAAIELGLFWILSGDAHTAEEVATRLGLPERRCRIWLELLVGLDLLERYGDGYTLSLRARREIVDAYGRETWQYLAREARERDLAGHDLALHLGTTGSVWTAQGIQTPDYVAQMSGNPDRARLFTRSSYELNRSMAEELAQRLDLSDARRMLDIGGGSGVMSLAFLRKHPALTATLVDVDPVCVAAREIVCGLPEASRLTFFAADFLVDDLPTGFDVVLASKVGIYRRRLYERVTGWLAPGGRLVIVDKLVDEGAGEPLSGLIYAFLSSLQDATFALSSIREVGARLTDIGFRVESITSLSTGETVIDARMAV